MPVQGPLQLEGQTRYHVMLLGPAANLPRVRSWP